MKICMLHFFHIARTFPYARRQPKIHRHREIYLFELREFQQQTYNNSLDILLQKKKKKKEI